MKNNLAESIEEINGLLIDHYGIDTISGNSIYRVVWSEDQLEKRWTSYTDSGVQLLQPEVREYPKYRQWIHEKYIIERLTIIPDLKIDGAPANQVSYESIWVFENALGDYLPPRFSVCKFVLDTLHAAEGKSSMAKYVDELINESAEVKESRLNKLQNELFENETDIGDALAYREGVSMNGPRFES